MFLNSFSQTIQCNQEFFFGRLSFFIFVSIAGLFVDKKCSLLSDDLKCDHLHINSSRETAKRPNKLVLEIAIPARTKRGYSSQFIEIQLLWRLLRSRRPSFIVSLMNFKDIEFDYIESGYKEFLNYIILKIFWNYLIKNLFFKWYKYFIRKLNKCNCH